MGRRRVELKRIERDNYRQISFSKRKDGLLKKAYEISTLCDVEVALIIFSSKGNLWLFNAKKSLEDILERYINLPEQRRGRLRDPELARIFINQMRESNIYNQISGRTSNEAGSLSLVEYDDASSLELLEIDQCLSYYVNGPSSIRTSSEARDHIERLEETLKRVQIRKQILESSTFHLQSIPENTVGAGGWLIGSSSNSNVNESPPDYLSNPMVDLPLPYYGIPHPFFINSEVQPSDGDLQPFSGPNPRHGRHESSSFLFQSISENNVGAGGLLIGSSSNSNDRPENPTVNLPLEYYRIPHLSFMSQVRPSDGALQPFSEPNSHLGHDESRVCPFQPISENTTVGVGGFLIGSSSNSNVNESLPDRLTSSANPTLAFCGMPYRCLISSQVQPSDGALQPFSEPESHHQLPSFNTEKNNQQHNTEDVYVPLPIEQRGMLNFPLLNQQEQVNNEEAEPGDGNSAVDFMGGSFPHYDFDDNFTF